MPPSPWKLLCMHDVEHRRSQPAGDSILKMSIPAMQRSQRASSSSSAAQHVAATQRLMPMTSAMKSSDACMLLLCTGAMAGAGTVQATQGSCTVCGAVDPVDQCELDSTRTGRLAGGPDCAMQPEAVRGATPELTIPCKHNRSPARFLCDAFTMSS